MKKIINPIPKEDLKKELNEKTFLRKTNNLNREIYIVTAHDSPQLMQEIGRLREISFRDAGGGTGKETDIDAYDTSKKPFKQLIVWSPEDNEIVGGYRFIEGSNIPKDENGKLIGATSALFNFSDEFIQDYLPCTIELGRSFVQPEFQPTFNIRKGIFSLDNLWDGLGALTIEYPNIKHFVGKFTMYPDFNRAARDIILYFLQIYFKDDKKLATPVYPVHLETSVSKLKSIFSENDFKQDYKVLIQNIRKYKENIPPLVNAYMNLSSTMKVFGTSINPHFGNVEETGILITIDDIYDIKKDRHISTYIKKK